MNILSPKSPLIETIHYKIWYDPQFFGVTLNKNVTITLDLAKNLVDVYRQVTQNTRAKVFADMTGMYSIDRESRRYFASSEVLENAICAAVLIENYLQYLAFEVFMTINTPSLTIRAFTDAQKAISWLQEYQ